MNSILFSFAVFEIHDKLFSLHFQKVENNISRNKNKLVPISDNPLPRCKQNCESLRYDLDLYYQCHPVIVRGIAYQFCESMRNLLGNPLQEWQSIANDENKQLLLRNYRANIMKKYLTLIFGLQNRSRSDVNTLVKSECIPFHLW